jgi:prolyl-tRNA synthetase
MIYRDLGKSFTEWFDWVLEAAELYDYGRYPAKGMGIWLPYGFRLRDSILKVMRNLLDSTGHEEILLPLLIPDHILAKESEHIRGFEAQVYWVTHGGIEPLDVKLALRPTSETSLTYLESFWIKSYKQLPKKFYQVVSMFRYETKSTKPMIRVREVTTFKEAHTVHESFEDSERQVKEAIDIYRKFFDELGVPYIISKRPEWDKFAGAIYTIAFDTLMPDGKALQIGTVHNLGQNFTKVFEVRIQKRDESIDYAWQTSYGISERVVASVIAIHGDGRGLVLPFKLAPKQVVIVPIYSSDKDQRNKVLQYCEKVHSLIKQAGIRCYIDLRDEMRPGEKFYYWEIRGVPIRIDIGMREVERNEVTIVRRDTLMKEIMKLEELPEALVKVGTEIDENLKERAWNAFKSKVRRMDDVDKAAAALDQERGIVELPWCGNDECSETVSERLNADALGTPLSIDKEEIRGRKCPVCGNDAVTFMRYAKKY